MLVDILIETLFYEIQALKREIDHLNQTIDAAPDEDLADLDAIFRGCETALEELKVAYQEKL